MDFRVQGGFSVNPDGNLPKKNNNQTEKSKEQKEIDYLKGNHPLESLGRSMVNFRGAVKKPTMEDCMKLVEENQLHIDEQMIGWLKDHWGKNPCENLELLKEICTRLKGRDDIDDFIQYNFLVSVNEDNVGLMKELLDDKKAAEIFCDHRKFDANDFHTVFRYTTNETKDMIKEVIINPDVNGYEKGEVFSQIIRPRGCWCKEEQAKKEALVKAKVYEKIKQASGGQFTYEGDPNIKNKIEFLVVSGTDNAELITRIAYLAADDLTEDERNTLFSITYASNENNADFLQKLIKEKFVSYRTTSYVAHRLGDREDLRYADEIYEYIKASGKKLDQDSFTGLVTNANKNNIEVIKKLCDDSDELTPEIIVSADVITDENYKFAKKLCRKTATDNIDKYTAKAIISKYTKESGAFIETMLADGIIPLDKDFYSHNYDRMNGISAILSLPKSVDKERYGEICKAKYEVYEKIKNDSDMDLEDKVDLLKHITEVNKDLTLKLLSDKRVEKSQIKYVINTTDTESKEKEEKIIKAKESAYAKIKKHSLRDKIKSLVSRGSSERDVRWVLQEVDDINLPLFNMLMDDKMRYDDIANIIGCNGNEAEKMKAVDIRTKAYMRLKALPHIDSWYTPQILSSLNENKVQFFNTVILDKNFSGDNIRTMLEYSTSVNSKEDEKEVFDTRLELYKKLKDGENLKHSSLASLLGNTNKNTADDLNMLLNDENFPNDEIPGMLEGISGYSFDIKKFKAKIDFYKQNKDKPDCDMKLIARAMRYIESSELAGKAEDIIFNSKETGLTPDALGAILSDSISYENYRSLIAKIGRKRTASLNQGELITYAKFIDAYKKENINELSLYGKRDLLKNLVSANTDIFSIDEETRKDFPLLPKNTEEYCALLPQIVRALGIETDKLSAEATKEFEHSQIQISNTLKDIDDETFAKLEITQEYSKEDFIKDTLNCVKDLSPNERQKVYDYFGFELHKNKKNETNFSISGYPVNLNNGKKLSQITDENTKQVVENLRPYVIKFSENNPVRCPRNPQLEEDLNAIFKYLPELHTLIGKTQHGSHDFDVLKHSLKVMQKIVQNEEYDKLNDSDKKLMLLASLLHDITKREGGRDITHATESSFDAFYITKKFNLSQEEEIKLYNLIRHHEWLGYVNSAKDDEILERRLKNTAYDLRLDNNFDMSLIFAHADLMAVSKDNSFHDRKEGAGRRVIDNEVKSFGETADIFGGKSTDTVKSKTIRGYINELKKSQPLLPVTKLPSASRIKEAITDVYSDGSTNLKGIYQNKDGLIVINYNQVENSTWEKIGLAKGSISKGIEAQGKTNERTGHGRETKEYTVDTGNIKFFVHGLDYPNQLAKFDAFPLPDSDVLLSVSYAERPESKFRFFRSQGVILDVDTKYVHGGGETDAGSGCGKSIDAIKKDYIFGGHRESDRLYISKLIKQACNMSDEEYIKFVKENENKPISEITPSELQETLVKAFATINSNERKGERAYNEMYASNPKPPMAVFAYAEDYNEKIKNPVEFLSRNVKKQHETKAVKERTKFLQEYAIKNDIPFIVFSE